MHADVFNYLCDFIVAQLPPKFFRKLFRLSLGRQRYTAVGLVWFMAVRLKWWDVERDPFRTQLESGCYVEFFLTR